MTRYEDDDRPLLIGDGRGNPVGQVGGEDYDASFDRDYESFKASFDRDYESFKPDWTCPPGDSIKEMCEERQISRFEFSYRSQLNHQQVHDLLRGALPIDEHIAEKIAKIGGTKEFWLRREAYYVKDLARLGQERPK